MRQLTTAIRHSNGGALYPSSTGAAKTRGTKERTKLLSMCAESNDRHTKSALANPLVDNLAANLELNAARDLGSHAQAKGVHYAGHF